MFYCRWGHKFAIKSFLCNTQYFYIVDCEINNTQNALLHFQYLRERATMLYYTHIPSEVSFVIGRFNWPIKYMHGSLIFNSTKSEYNFTIQDYIKQFIYAVR